MRNAALILGIIGGLLGMLVGFFGYARVAFVEAYGEIPDVISQVDNPAMIQTISILAPVLAIAGGAMSRARALWGGILLLISTAGMAYAFGIGVFTVFPMAFTGIAGLLAIAAGKPDEEKAHF